MQPPHTTRHGYCKGDGMPGKKREVNPSAMIAVGICFMGAGTALTAALRGRGTPGAGVGLISLGVILLAIGAGAKRKAESGESGGDKECRPPG